jgi:hypothetical protein
VQAPGLSLQLSASSVQAPGLSLRPPAASAPGLSPQVPMSLPMSLALLMMHLEQKGKKIILNTRGVSYALYIYVDF